MGTLPNLLRETSLAHAQVRQLQTAYEHLQKLINWKQEQTFLLLHDLQTPLHRICQQVAEPTLKQTAQQMLSLIQQAMAIQKKDKQGVAVVLKPLYLHILINKAVEQVQFLLDERELRVNIVNKIALFVMCDEGLVFRVLTNLLTNAIKFSAEGKDINVLMEERKDTVWVGVVNHGQTLTENEKNSLFKPYSQLKNRRGGTGLGLYFCKQVITAQDGTIGVDSMNDETTFWFTLPKLTKKEAPTTTQAVKFRLSALEAVQLNPLLPKFKELEVYDYTAVYALLEAVEPYTKGIQTWKTAMLNALDRCDQSSFQFLLHLLDQAKSTSNNTVDDCKTPVYKIKPKKHLS
ncbi:MAG: sensor histidine kinase [Flammeovirgaceae bacterium]